jgi:hypothetical protein
MSFREKLDWIALVSTLAIWGFYFLRLTQGHAAGVPAEAFMGLMVRCLVLSVIVQVILVSVVAARSPKEANALADERERMIELTSIETAFYVLAGGVIVAALGAAFGADVLQVVNAILAALVLAEVVRAVRQILQLRRVA